MSYKIDVHELPAKWRLDRPDDPHSDAWMLGYLRAKRHDADELEAALRQSGEAATDTLVQTVPDKCDRIVWRGHYYHLPITAPPATSGLVETLRWYAEQVEGCRKIGTSATTIATPLIVMAVSAPAKPSAAHDAQDLEQQPASRNWWTQCEPNTDLDDANAEIGFMREDWQKVGEALGFTDFVDPEVIIATITTLRQQPALVVDDALVDAAIAAQDAHWANDDNYPACAPRSVKGDARLHDKLARGAMRAALTAALARAQGAVVIWRVNDDYGL